MHNGYLMVDGEKMSKSLGNFFTVQDLLAKAPGEAVRLCLLSTHYHQPLNWTDDGLAQAKQTLDRFYTALERVGEVAAATEGVAALLQPVVDALMDDLNTPAAIAAMHDLASQLNKATAPGDQAVLKAALQEAAGLLGILEATPEAWRRGSATAADGPSDAEIDAMVAARTAARASRDFAEADRLRKALADAGVTLEDGAAGTKWRRE